MKFIRRLTQYIIGFVERHIVWTITLLIITGLGYKYNREIFFKGEEYEITYAYKGVDKICSLSTCNPGMVIDVVNTGSETTSRAVIEISGLGTREEIIYDIKQSYLINTNNKSIENNEKFDEQQRAGTLIFLFKEIPSMWHIKVSLTTINDSFKEPKKDWNDVDVRVYGSGKGSVLKENPYKVVILRDFTQIYKILQHKGIPSIHDIKKVYN